MSKDTKIKKVALLLIYKKDKFLLFKRSSKETTNANKYGLLGGGIEENETPEQAIVREVMEEAGVVLNTFKKLKKYTYDGLIIHLFYTNKFNEKDIKLNNEHSSSKWFNFDELKELPNIIPTNITFAKDFLDKNKVSEELHRMRTLVESYDPEHARYLSWKRKNVTIRGVSELGSENKRGAMLGNGLYTAFLSNRALAKEYGKIYFVVGAIPKKPKVFNDLNQWEIWYQYNLLLPVSREQGLDYPSARVYYESGHSIEDDMLKLGYDGIVIRGREMVNFKPDTENILYFDNEHSLKQYYLTSKNVDGFNESESFMKMRAGANGKIYEHKLESQINKMKKLFK